MTFRPIVGNAPRCAATIALLCAAVGCADDARGSAFDAKSRAKDAVSVQLVREEADAAVAADVGADTSRRPLLIGELSAGAVTEAQLSLEQRYLAWTFRADADAVVRVEVGAVEADGLDTVLLVYRANDDGLPFGQAIAFDDDGGGGLDSATDVRLPESRRYVLVVRSFEGDATGRVWASLRDDILL